VVHCCVEVEILQIDSAVKCILCRHNALEMKFDSDNVGSRCAAVIGVVDKIAIHCDLYAVGVLLLRSIVDEDPHVHDVTFAYVEDVFVPDRNNSVGAFSDTVDSLGKTPEFLCRICLTVLCNWGSPVGAAFP
jgi:hypothetical protein